MGSDNLEVPYFEVCSLVKAITAGTLPRQLTIKMRLNKD
jgi:hypothetical protein